MPFRVMRYLVVLENPMSERKPLVCTPILLFIIQCDARLFPLCCGPFVSINLFNKTQARSRACESFPATLVLDETLRSYEEPVRCIRSPR
jgi:hypothetical protein